MVLVVPRQCLKALRPVLNRAVTAVPQQSQTRGMQSIETMDPDHKRVAPWPYETKPYNYWRALYDDVTHRFDENTKVVVVDGPPGTNKDGVCKEIAKTFNMKYLPPPSLDRFYVDRYGFDLRTLNHRVPPNTRSWDLHQFFATPKHFLSARMTQMFMELRFHDYMAALNHLFNTGQGVVLNRSIYSDIVFNKTWLDHGFITKPAYDFIQEQKHNAMFRFLKPHVLVYLDMSPQQIVDTVAKRNRAGEKNSPVYTEEVMTTLLDNYKKLCLRPLSEHAEVLVYDWATAGDPEGVVEDMTRLKLEGYEREDTKMHDWYAKNEWDWKAHRMYFSGYAYEQLEWLHGQPMKDVPELFVPHDDALEYRRIRGMSPSQKYMPGYNPEMGDSVLWKNQPPQLDYLILKNI